MSNVNVTKQGTWNSPDFSNLILSKYDKNIYTLSDGSTWTRLVHHNDPATNKFSQTDNFLASVYKSENCWFDMNKCFLVSNGQWEIMLKQAPTASSPEQVFRWIQYDNPMEGATFENTKNDMVNFIIVTGTTSPSQSFGGMYFKNINSFLVCNDGRSGDTWGSIGCWAPYQGGIPGYNGQVITSGYIDVYLRVPTHALVGTAAAKSECFYEI